MDAEIKNYEIAYLINPDVPEDGVFGEVGKITGLIQDAHGLVGKIQEPKKRKLAYPISKSLYAYFGWTTFAVAPERIANVEKRLRLEKSILRYLMVEEVKRPVMQFRPRGGGIPRRALATPHLEGVAPFTPAQPKEEDQVKIQELDKRLEEILGK